MFLSMTILGEDAMKMAEEPLVLGVEELKSLETWGHFHPIILKVGRCSHIPPVGMEEDAKAEYLEKLEAEDKVEERFKAINEDAPIPSLETSWISRICGDNQ